MSAYFDTSVVAVGMLHDPGVGKFKRWLKDSPQPIFWSDFGRGELVSAVALRVRLKTIDETAARTIIEAIPTSTCAWTCAEVQPDDIAAATEMVGRFELNLKLPDAIHIAIAQRLDCTLVSSDRTQLTAAEKLGLRIADPLALLFQSGAIV